MAHSFAVLIRLGRRSGRLVTVGDDETGVPLAGRSPGPIVGASAIVATGLSGWGIVGSPGVAREFGAVELP